jgi:uncharacterized protein YfiM (DUF2279 family)
MNELAHTLLIALRLLVQPAVPALEPSALSEPGMAMATSSVGQLELTPPLLFVQQTPREDRWLGQDKFRHFWMSYASTAFSFAAARSVEIDRDVALPLSMGAAAMAGVGKELYDRKHSFFSPRDLVADALGIAAGYFLLRELR